MAKRIIFLVLALVGTFLVVYLSTNGSSGYSEVGGTVGNWINDTFFDSSLTSKEVSSITHFGWKGVGHVALYAFTGISYSVFFSTFPGMKMKRTVLVGIGIVLAIAGEVTQLFTPTRTAAFGDVVINFVSFASLPAIAGLYLRTR